MDTAAAFDLTEPLTRDLQLLAAADYVAQNWDLLLNNRFQEAKNAVKPLPMNIKDSIYHSAAYASLAYLNGAMSFDKDDIESAIKSLTNAIALCDARSHKWSLFDNVLMQMFISTDYNTYTEEELHSEFIKAQCCLAKAILTFVKDDSILSFMRGALYVRTSHQLYKRCYDALEHRTWPNNILKRHFECGVKFGLGAFNLVISALPKRYLVLLEFVGFSGNKELGLKFLKTCHEMQETFTGVISSLAIFSYYGNILYLMGNGSSESEIKLCEEMLPFFKEKYPQGTLTLYYAGRLRFMRGSVEEAIELLTMSINSPSEWTGFHQLVYFELYNCHLAIGNYRVSVKFADTLSKESRWSDCSVCYMKAAAMLMCDDLTSDERSEVESIMRSVPRKRQTLAGRYLPPETYFACRAERFILEGNFLMLPALEFMYIWNYLKCLHGKMGILEPIMQKIDSSLADLSEGKIKESRFYMDHYCMGLLLKALCLNLMLKPKIAKLLFLEIINNKKDIYEDHFLVSCARMELGFIYCNKAKYEKATLYLERAKMNATFFAEFRIHQALDEIRLVQKQ